MTEKHVGFLFNAASCLLSSENKNVKNILRSYYLMRCDEISKTGVLPNRYFSPKLRCPHCCIEWDNSLLKIKSRKLSKQQRRRLRLKAVKKKDPNLLKELSYKKELEHTCSFCKHTTSIPVAKLDREKDPQKVSVGTTNGIQEKKKKKIDNVVLNNPKKNSQQINVYANSKDIFSLKNNENTLKSVKEQPKVIKNNKKKKDKFAGLCQKAVLATAKLKEEQKKQNKLNLFLKPST